ncbi:MAG: CHASE3 domain-containing protein [Proteobacteria bacterium]|nr:CHASE3 domain-containing protein [Pseudomonadota bacterium]
MNPAIRQLGLAVLLAAVLGLYLAAQSGQQRLDVVSRQVATAAARDHAIGDLLRLLNQAESSQRGYILLGDDSYLAPYEIAVDQVPTALARLEQGFAGASAAQRRDVEDIVRLSRAKFIELGEVLRLYREHGRKSAVEVTRTDIGKWTMTHLSARAQKMQAAEAASVVAAARSWRNVRWINLAVTTSALAVALALLLLLRSGVLRYLRHKEQETEQLSEKSAELEKLVSVRTLELSQLSTHLQSVTEQERAALSRELHDELGGVLVAARMDVTWLEQRAPGGDPQVRAHFRHLHEALQTGVDVKRRVVENLRPTLLDNFGLLAALRWQMENTCGRAGIGYTESYPEQELELTADASIAVFRVVQEALTNILKHARARHVQLRIRLAGPWLELRIQDDGIGAPAGVQPVSSGHGIMAMRHRVTGLGGQWRLLRPANGGTRIEARLPLVNLLPEIPTVRRARAHCTRPLRSA